MAILKSISEGLKFSISIKRIASYLILNLVLFYMLIDFFGKMFRYAMGLIGIDSVILSLFTYIPIFIILALIGIWINGAIIDQAKYYRKKRLLIKSFKYSTSRFLTMFCALVIYVIINAIFSSTRYIGYLLSIVINLIFFYLYQAIIVDKKGCINSFKQSWRVFKNYPLETFVTWLLVVIIGFIIIGIFALPIIFYLLWDLASAFQTMALVNVNETMYETIFRSEIIPIIANSISSVYFLPYLFIFCIGLAIQKVFSLGAKTRLYINLKKREF